MYGPSPRGRCTLKWAAGTCSTFLPQTCADVDLSLSFSDLIALQSFSLVCVSTTQLLATCGPSVPLLPNFSQAFTVAHCLMTLTTIRTVRRGEIPQRRIYLTNCPNHGRVPSGNAIRCLMDRAVTSVLHGAYFASVARPRKRHGLSVSFHLSSRGHLSCLVRHSRNYPTQIRSISSTRLACTCQRCYLTSPRHFHMRITCTFLPGSSNQQRLTYYNACSSTHPIRVSRLLMRGCIPGY
jgi:hypothetical protein